MANLDPLPYVYSIGNTFAAFTKFNSKNYFVWRRNMETQLRALGQWEIVDGTIAAPRPVDPDQPPMRYMTPFLRAILWTSYASVSRPSNSARSCVLLR